jgi:hypothetical protein
VLPTKPVDNSVTKWLQTLWKAYETRRGIKLTINWTAFLKDNLEPPKTLGEAVDRLMAVLDDEHKLVIAAMPEDDLIALHFSLGTAIRNAFGLHDQDNLLVKSLGSFVHPDDVSMVIINALWKKLTQE